MIITVTKTKIPALQRGFLLMHQSVIITVRDRNQAIPSLNWAAAGAAPSRP
jgi:hypothetical protein